VVVSVHSREIIFPKTLAAILDQAGLTSNELSELLQGQVMRKYTIVLEPDDQGRGYTVLVPALPGCITQGRSKEEALERAREAIAAYIESLEADGEPVPEERRRIQVLKVAV
jgi:antitoxin HicB